ncbi:iron ABC transporter permease [Bacillus sp. FJAT-47783]|uniref:FecCD family ABC transporter permease n=1 Tax=Bacillus sp. FJAT-47783 TaxID=2922712 RepID=UPI001FAE59CC|nr:iron ABC transporter permease [Bacillus sp. FJAT-47783]
MKKYTAFRFGKGAVSFLLDKSAVKVCSILTFLSIMIILLSSSVGEIFYSPNDLIQALIGNGSSLHELVIFSFRFPRIFIALFVGVCLAVAGAIMQNLFRNPLASPDIIGVTGGASVAVVLFLTIFSDTNHSLTVSIGWMPVAAFIGACLTGVAVYLFAWKDGVSTFRLVLIGIGLSLLTKSLTTLFMIKGPIYQASQANIWITGSVYAANWSQVYILFPLTVILLIISVVMTRNVNIQEFGDEIATGVGSHVERNRFLLLMLSTALVASAVSFAGGISFVGLIAPHIARRLVGSSFGVVLPVSALIGAIIVMLSDLLGKTLFLPLEVPAGVFTALIGAPYFIYLLYKHRNS